MRSSLGPSQVSGPSRVFGRPETAAAPPTPDAPRPPRRGGRLRGTLVVVLLLALVGGTGALVAPDEVGEGGVPPARVDIVSEEQAIAALALYGAQAEVYDEFARIDSLYAPPGPVALIERLRDGAVESERRRFEARGLPEQDTAFREYAERADHAFFHSGLMDSWRTTGEISLLLAVHDSLYDGAGSIQLPDAQLQLTSLFETGTTVSGPHLEWGQSLLAEVDGQDRRADAERLRVETDHWWRGAVLEHARPAAQEPLRAYLGGLPEPTLTGLEGHPVAGPALQRLREGSDSVEGGARRESTG